MPGRPIAATRATLSRQPDRAAPIVCLISALVMNTGFGFHFRPEFRSTPPRSLRDHMDTVAGHHPCPPRPPSCRCPVPLPPDPTPRTIRDWFDLSAEPAVPEHDAAGGRRLCPPGQG